MIIVIRMRNHSGIHCTSLLHWLMSFAGKHQIGTSDVPWAISISNSSKQNLSSKGSPGYNILKLLVASVSDVCAVSRTFYQQLFLFQMCVQSPGHFINCCFCFRCVCSLQDILSTVVSVSDVCAVSSPFSLLLFLFQVCVQSPGHSIYCCFCFRCVCSL